MPLLPGLRLANIERIREGKASPLLAGHPLLSGGFAAGLAEEGFERLLNDTLNAMEKAPSRLTLDDLADPAAVTGEVVALSRGFERFERSNRDALEALAVAVVAEAHGLDGRRVERLVGEAALSGPEGLGFVGDDCPAEDARTRPRGEVFSEDEASLAAKRLTANAIIAGMALQYGGLVLARSELEELCPDVHGRYTLFVHLAALLHYLFPLDRLPRLAPPRAGRVRVEWDLRGEPRISARAIHFPILTQELTQGLWELVHARALPRAGDPGMSRRPQETLLASCDDERLEAWHFLVGPPLARRLTRALVRSRLVLRYGSRPEPGVDMAFTMTLLSLVPTEELHAALPDFLSDDPQPHEAAARTLGRLLEEARYRATH